MNRNRRISAWMGLIPGAVVAVALNATLAGAADDQPLVTEEFHHTYPLNPNGRVEVQNINGAVHITAGDGNEVKVDAIKRAEDEQDLKDEEIRVDASADSISIETKYHQREETWRNSHHRGAEVEYTLTVPRNARLDEIKLINGRLDIAGVTGEVRASCINGKLVARGLAGEVRLQTINGPLEADFNQAHATPIELSSVKVQHANDGHALSPARDLGDREKGDEI